MSNMQKSLVFYRDLLGIPLARLILEEGWAEFEINPGTLILGYGDSFISPGGGMVALAVDDAEATVGRVETGRDPGILASGGNPCVLFGNHRRSRWKSRYHTPAKGRNSRLKGTFLSITGEKNEESLINDCDYI